MSQYDDTPRNRIKVAHLVLGCFFLGIATLWALAESGNLTWHGTSYALPVTLLIAGAIGLAANLLGNGANRRRSRKAPVDPAPDLTETGTIDDTDTDDTRRIR